MEEDQYDAAVDFASLGCDSRSLLYRSRRFAHSTTGRGYQEWKGCARESHAPPRLELREKNMMTAIWSIENTKSGFGVCWCPYLERTSETK